MITVMAWSLRYGLVLGGCLRDAAAAFDDIFVALMPGAARELERLVAEIGGSLNGIGGDMVRPDGTVSNGVLPH